MHQLHRRGASGTHPAYKRHSRQRKSSPDSMSPTFRRPKAPLFLQNTGLHISCPLCAGPLQFQPLPRTFVGYRYRSQTAPLMSLRDICHRPRHSSPKHCRTLGHVSWSTVSKVSAGVRALSAPTLYKHTDTRRRKRCNTSRAGGLTRNQTRVSLHNWESTQSHYARVPRRSVGGDDEKDRQGGSWSFFILPKSGAAQTKRSAHDYKHRRRISYPSSSPDHFHTRRQSRHDLLSCHAVSVSALASLLATAFILCTHTTPASRPSMTCKWTHISYSLYLLLSAVPLILTVLFIIHAKTFLCLALIWSLRLLLSNHIHSFALPSISCYLRAVQEIDVELN